MSALIRVWDAPLRLFHWLLALSVITAIVTGVQGGSWIEWHAKTGLFIVGLLSFRLVWLVLGSTYARIPALWHAFVSLPEYLKGRWVGLGHNPLGVLSMAAMLLLLGWQALSGLFTTDDIAFTGPLYRLVSSADSLALTGWHRLAFWPLVILISLHVLAVLFHVFIKKHNIIKSMITGKTERLYEQQLPAKGGNALVFIVALVLAIGAVYLASGAWQAPPPPPPVSAPVW